MREPVEAAKPPRHARLVSLRIWLLVATLAGVLGVIAPPFGVGLARATTAVSPNCAQRAALAAFATAVTACENSQTTRRASKMG